MPTTCSLNCLTMAKIFTFSPLASAVASPANCSTAFMVSLPMRFYGQPNRRCRPLCTVRVAVVSRYGGGGYREARRGQRDPRAADPDYDSALDLDLIKSSSVRLLDEQQNMVGVVSIDDAIRRADNSDLILAILSADADPPVLRLFEIEDYKKHKYEQQKKKRDQQKRTTANRQDTKELKMGYNIDSHDYSVRLKAAKKFLKDGDKVKVIVSLKGRENEFRNIAIELIKRFQSDIGEMAMEESKNFSDRNIFMVLMPNKATVQRNQEQPKKKEASKSEVSASIKS